VKLALQRAVGDCGIAAIATWTEQSYEDVYLACSEVERRYRGRAGLTLDALVALAGRLGLALTAKRKGIDLHQDEGILGVQWTKKCRDPRFSWHFVLLYNGVVVDPADGVVLEAEDYMVREHAVPRVLLEERR
jgi:hypothetical protein